ncbi:MAG: PKD domain-containing protein, partial [Lentisphaeria bacterium]|nr:PKD domain-containing protein [Lentisphaeria bacterium]
NIIFGGYGDDEIVSYNLDTRIFGGFGNDDITADPDSGEVDDGAGSADVITDYDAVDQPSTITILISENTVDNPVRYIVDWGDGTYTIIDVSDSLNPYTADFVRVAFTGDFVTDYLEIGGTRTDSAEFGYITHNYPDREFYQPSMIIELPDDSEIPVDVAVIDANMDFQVTSVEYPGSIFIFDEIAFSASAFDIGLNNAITYIWDFGDGQTGEGPAVTHDYESTGTYHASLTILDPDGVSVTYEFIVIIMDNPDVVYYPPQATTPAAIHYVNAYHMPFSSAFESTGFDSVDLEEEEEFGNRYFYNPDANDDSKALNSPDFFWPTEDEIDELLELEFLNEDEAEEESKSKLDDVNILDEGTPGTEPDEEEDKKESSKEDDSSDSKPKKSPSFLNRMLSGMFGWMF